MVMAGHRSCCAVLVRLSPCRHVWPVTASTQAKHPRATVKHDTPAEGCVRVVMQALYVMQYGMEGG